MKLIIQIPCYNEEQSLPVTLAKLPREVEGISKVEWLIINDGSTDKTAEVAKKLGVDHVVSFAQNRGLAKAFMAGIQRCLEEGADIIVNTDADDQYCADDIPKLVAPILQGRADYVIGARPIDQTPHFSPLKKLLQRIGSWVVRVVSKTDVPDAPSGFRALSREAAIRLNVFSEYTYTLETIIQTGQSGLAVASVPIRTNRDLRPSRLVKSIRAYVQKSLITIIRIFMTYRSFRFFAIPGLFFSVAGGLIGLRFLYYFVIGEGSGRVQSLILCALLIGSGFFLIATGLIADLVAVNRKLLEKIDVSVQKIRLHQVEADRRER